MIASESQIFVPLPPNESRTFPGKSFTQRVMNPAAGWSLTDRTILIDGYEVYSGSGSDAAVRIVGDQQNIESLVDLIHHVYDRIPDDDPLKEEWMMANTGVGSLGKISEPRKIKGTDPEHPKYYVSIYSNHTRTREFKDMVLAHFVNIGLMPKEVLMVLE